MKMKQLLSLLMMSALGISAFSADEKNAVQSAGTGKKALIVYFSWSSAQNTKQMAERIAATVGGDLFRVETAQAYSSEYNKAVQEAKVEVQQNARPALKATMTQQEIDQYETIFVGYPVWWYDAPMAIYTFLESFDLSNKTVIPFATSGGSGLSDRNLRSKIKASFKDGLCIVGYRSGESSEQRIARWLSGLGFGK